MTIETGALEQAYADVEASYAVDAATGGAALVGSDAISILQLDLGTKLNRENSPEKRGTPDVVQKLPRRQTSNWNLGEIMWQPSGTLGTRSNIAKFIKAAMGAEHNIAAGLNTTIASGAAATGATLTSVTGLAVGDLVAVLVAGIYEPTRIKTLAGSVVTWDELSAVPASPGSVISGTTFQLASNITDSLSIYKYHNAGGFKQAVYGAVVEQAQFMFDGTREVRAAFQGPAGRYADGSPGGGTVQAKPGTHVTVGSPASGLVGGFWNGTDLFMVINVQASLTNTLLLRNKELGTRWASGIAGREGNRAIPLQITFYLEDLALLGMAHSVQTGTMRWLIGDTPGSMLAAVAPRVEFEVPDFGNENGPKEITINGDALATVGNDQIFLGEL
jgi:hypothetical protein